MRLGVERVRGCRCVAHDVFLSLAELAKGMQDVDLAVDAGLDACRLLGDAPALLHRIVGSEDGPNLLQRHLEVPERPNGQARQPRELPDRDSFHGSNPEPSGRSRVKGVRPLHCPRVNISSRNVAARDERCASALD